MWQKALAFVIAYLAERWAGKLATWVKIQVASLVAWIVAKIAFWRRERAEEKKTEEVKQEVINAETEEERIKAARNNSRNSV